MDKEQIAQLLNNLATNFKNLSDHHQDRAGRRLFLDDRDRAMADAYLDARFKVSKLACKILESYEVK